MATKATTSRTFGMRATLGAMALALLVTVGGTAGVGAERPPSGGDSHQQGCRALYDQAERLRNEYKQVATANPGSARLDAILAELRNVGQTWQDIKCGDRYGSISHLVAPPTPSVFDQVIGVDIDLIDAGPIVVANPGDDEPDTDEPRKGKKGKKGKKGRR